MPVQPKQTFAALDGVRGIAALAVMMFHIAWWPHFGRPFPSAYLAVDLFFTLSGFVVAHAYSPRLSQGLSALAFLPNGHMLMPWLPGLRNIAQSAGVSDSALKAESSTEMAMVRANC